MDKFEFATTSAAHDATTETGGQMGRLWASTGQLRDTCSIYNELKKYGELISTAFTVRDLMEIVDAVEDNRIIPANSTKEYRTFQWSHAISKIIDETTSQPNEAWEDVRKYAVILNNAGLSAAADNFIEDLEQ
ncbi:hypothetical protein FQN52_000556 [Onygenales sp. PD_12]|nr:hypothetical protein FQN52_000556 [Onygenales sp. PD_12]